ncbi:D-alanyl-D-alanine carboxypeptidase/D-alanyl-D-alanine endopeptidase [Neobacillus jeddahensis]|uniref:D-alanyl-D-alanine carboxypeptidase/D-alanyl-D-alanine endopeptidase n=1 Tax=Neobacillus jeddahensis TaxID=1461580 RepID=UPI00058D0B9E|nr:D-alanyl-D-alanine carboxypeptidase/D-alanyl-D-alanine-endopeptidase [Neobacillus jeddahensis]
MKKRTFYRVFFIFTMMTVYLPGNRVQAVNSTLGQQLNDVLKKEPALQGAIAGISIRSAVNGEVLYDYQGNVRLRPASNMKLLTAAAALSVLGSDYTFATEVYANGPVKKQVLQGNLYIKGKGDPTLLKMDFDTLASEVKKKGIKKITGDLVADDSWYDDVRYSLDLPWSDETTYYGAQISALTVSPTKDYDSGSLRVSVKPGLINGDPVQITITPKTNYVKIINCAQTGAIDSKKEITVKREHAKNTITIEGTLPLKSKPTTEWIGVWNPTTYANTLFKQSLAQQGVKVLGKIKQGTVPDTARMVTNHSSMRLADLLVPFLKLSNNVHAEMLIKEIGKVSKGEGSWDKGIPVMKAEVAKLGVNPSTLVIRDGSGISHVDLIPANQLTQLLFAVQKETWFPAYLHALPVAGAKEKMVGGSLRNRLKSQATIGKVKAKTGTISTVSSLSGYVTTKNGETLIFSIMLNNLLDENKGKVLEDRLVQIMANT